MLIQVVGTMGSGKTTLIRRWMGTLPTLLRVGKGPRPEGYECPERRLFLMGAYDPDLQTSGCDSRRDLKANYAELEARHAGGWTVVFEGLMMMNHTRGLELQARTRAMVVLRLVVPLEVCRAGVLARREAQDTHRALSSNFDDGLVGNDVRARNYAHKLKQVGVPVYRVSREEALPKLAELTTQRELT